MLQHVFQGDQLPEKHKFLYPLSCSDLIHTTFMKSKWPIQKYHIHTSQHPTLTPSTGYIQPWPLLCSSHPLWWFWSWICQEQFQCTCLHGMVHNYYQQRQVYFYLTQYLLKKIYIDNFIFWRTSSYHSISYFSTITLLNSFVNYVMILSVLRQYSQNFINL